MSPTTTKTFHKNILLLGLLLYSCVTIIQFNTAFNWATCVSVIAFISYMILLYQCIDYENDYYATKRLFFTVTIYSFIMVLLFWWLSWYIDGDTYIFSKSDALLYERVCLKLKDLPYTDGFKYLKGNHPFDDWGAMLSMSIFMRIIPSKVFLNLCYILIGSTTSVLLFKIGKHFMASRYAYVAALAFCASSYNMFFYGSFLKESIFVFLVVCLFYNLTSYIFEQRKKSILFVIIFSILVCFFRPATVGFIWMGIFSYFLFKNGSDLKKLTALIIIIVFTMIMMTSLQNILDRYTMGGDIDKLLDTKEATGLSKELTYTINFFASFFGPFPTLIGTEQPRSCLYGAGLLYKFFLNLPFYLAVWIIIKERQTDLFPLIIFIFLEAFSVAIVQKGFEFRLNLPHTAFFYLMAFWGFSKFDKENNNDEYKFISFQKLLTPFFIFSFFIIFGWGILR